ncbi:MAG: hypothetical protein J5764_06615 [Bacteroidales bacterium]|nr:hypothetical protein [Bacteroidales bacterium]
MKKILFAFLSVALLAISCKSNDEEVLIIPRDTPSEWMEIGCVNWADQYPRHPDVKFRLWHDGEFFYIEFVVKEPTTRAEQDVQGGFVHLDSCLECYIHPDPENNPYYYSYEWNATGHMFLAWRRSRDELEKAPLDVINSVKTYPSLGTEPFSETALPEPWTLKVAIPVSSMYHTELDSWSGFECNMNFHKCTQGIEDKDFVSWAPIDTPEPTFNKPVFFRPAKFAE